MAVIIENMDLPLRCGDCRFLWSTPHVNICLVNFAGITWKPDSLEHECPLKAVIPAKETGLGHWISSVTEEGISWQICSECGEQVAKKYNFCPCCGAVMENAEG